MKHKVLSAIIFFVIFLFQTQKVTAFNTSKLGVHILSPSEIGIVNQVVGLSDQPESWHFTTIPLTLSDIDKRKDWQKFFDDCVLHKIIPIVRLTTRYDHDLQAWVAPTKKNVVDQIEFLSSLRWPTDSKHIIIYNEVNHSKEWSGRIDSQEYTRTLRFASDWAHTEQQNFIVLPAGLDLAANNSTQTREAFRFLSEMLEYDENIFEVVDIWNSHSYPNPGFSSSPTRYAKNSLRGYQFELAFLKKKTGKDFNVMITETGWDNTLGLSKWLSTYYAYAFQHIWSDDAVLAVTPFVLKGAPGPFEGFSFFDESNQPTAQFYAFRSGLEKVIELNKFQQVGLK